MGNSKKVLVIGWDAADWKMIKPLIAQGKMPTLKKFLEEGVHGNIATLDPPLSPMLWTTIATGKRAYDHGILGFTEPQPDGSGIRPVNSTSRKVKAIWNILNQNGYQSNVVAWWPSHPAEPINGVMVSNFYQLAKGKIDESWPMLNGTVYPEKFEKELAELRLHPNELTGAHILPFIPKAATLDIEKEKRLQIMMKTLAHASSVHNAATFLQEETPWDFMAVYHDAVDHFSHAFMKLHPPMLPGTPIEEFEKYSGVMEACYRFHDMMLERNLQLVDENTTVVILSDHGFHSDHLRPIKLPNEPAAPAHEHSPYGIIAIKGPGIKKGEQIYGASLLDVTPTLLTLFDLPVAKDMEGRPLSQIFENPKAIAQIESWEDVAGNDGMHKKGLKEDPWAGREALNQLIELGYVDKPDENKVKAIEMTYNESQYNLARAYADGAKHKSAIPIFESLVKKDPKAVRYVYHLIPSYLAVGQFDKCAELIAETKKHIEATVSQLDYFEGLMLLSEKKYMQAREKFDLINKYYPHSASIHVQIGKAYRLQEKWDEAIKAYDMALSIDKGNAHAHHGKGIALFEKGEIELAMEHFFEVISLTYFFPHAHYFLGECFLKLIMVENAVQSFEIALSMGPKIHKARKWLVEIYGKQLKNKEKAAFHKQFLPKEGEEIIVVSGLPRSGTSMVMQMLHAGGVKILTDHNREADQNNPKGYFEFEEVKKMGSDVSWMKKAKGKAVKIIAQLIPYLPQQFTYKIIYIERPLFEVLVSQQVMLGKSKEEAMKNFPFQMAVTYEEQVKRVDKWIDGQPNIEVLRLNHSDVMENPKDAANQIAEFLGQPLNTNKMVEAVDKKLYRNKLT